VNVAPGGTLLFCEMMAPGRVAMGEQFAFEELKWSIEVTLDELTVVKERYRLKSTDASLAGVKSNLGTYHGSWYAVGPAFTGKGAIDLSSFLSCPKISGATVGFSRLIFGGWLVRFLAEDSVALRKAVGLVRNFLYQTASRRMPSLRRGDCF